MKYLLLFNLLFTFLHANHLDNNVSEEEIVIKDANVTKEIDLEEIKVLAPQEKSSDENVTQEVKIEVPKEELSKDLNTTQDSEDVQRPKEDVIVVKDNSGLSVDEVRKKATEDDKEKVSKVSVADVVSAIDEKGNVDISKIQDRWEDLSPSPVKFDWLQTKSGEWFKGEIKALYDDELEFDSDEIGLYTFDFDDVIRIKSHNIISVNIENLATFPGILRLNGDKLTIIQGENKYDFNRDDVVSFAPDGKYERNFWSVKITASLDLRKGNTNQFDYSAKMMIQRRTAISRLLFDYLGRVTSKNETETANDHRLNQKYDRYITKHFFWTPIFSEFYSDPYKNINQQFTLGAGVGYTLIDTKKITLNVSAGPAYLHTKYVTVAEGKSSQTSSPAVELSTKYEHELNDIVDMTYSYKLTYANSSSGTYKHHMLLTFENEITSWLDIDITGVWDHILHPEETAEHTIPVSDDFQVLIGLGVEF